MTTKIPARFSILHLSTTDFEGGAAKAAVRLHVGLRSLGVDSSMLVQQTQQQAPGIVGPQTGPQKIAARLVPYLDRLAPVLAGNRKGRMFHAACLPDRLAPRIAAANPAVVHAHWTAQGFLRLETLGRLGRPLVMTLHDMWGLTGGCHVAGDCRRFETGCGRCPMLAGRPWDLSARVVRRKRRSWPIQTMVVVAPSRWMAAEAEASRALEGARVVVIPNGLDSKLFRPVGRKLCREVLGLHPKADYLVFGAIRALDDANKGMGHLQEALARLARRLPAARRKRLRLALFGAWPSEKSAALPFPVDWLGPIRDDRVLSLAYGAADAVVVPSRVESFGQVASEAQACGTPVACFDTTGLRDVVEHGRTGYRAKAFEAEDLSEGMRVCLEKRDAFGRGARERALKYFDHAVVAKAHLAAYEEAVHRHARPRA